MPSYKEDPAVSAQLDELLGPMSLGESGERKVESENNNEEAKKNTRKAPTKKFCSACGKESYALKYCNGCKCVWYCDKDCQNKHRKAHEKKCRRIEMELERRGGKLNLGTEIEIGPLGKVLPREECPICMRVLPINLKYQTRYLCCGKTLCCGCDHQYLIKNGVPSTCAFCRTMLPESDEEALAQLRKRVELKDPHALYNMALYHRDGNYGLPVDEAKCIDLLHQAADLGSAFAQYQLGNYHEFGMMGLEQNEEEMLKYWEKAAEDGNVPARHKLGCSADRNDNHVAAMRHWRLSASAGDRGSMENLIACFEQGLFHHGDLAETLRAMYLAGGEMRSKDRDQYIEHLKRTGQFNLGTISFA